MEKQKEVWQNYEEILKKSRKDIAFCKQLRDMYPVIAGHYAYCLKNDPTSLHRKRLEKFLRLSRKLLDRPVENSDRNIFARIFEFYFRSLPNQIYQSQRFVFASMFFFWMCVSISFLLTVENPEFGGAFLGSEQYHHYRSQIEAGVKFQNFFLPESHKPVVFVAVFLNNVKVALLTAMSGILFGIGMFYVLMSNAFLVGGLSGIYYRSPHFVDFMTQIFQHGFIELMAICLAGASGLLIATPFFYSGHIRRKDYFKKRIKQSRRLFIGCVSMLFMAAAIEGLITTLHLPLHGRYLVIFLSMLFFFGYLIYSLRPARSN